MARRLATIRDHAASGLAGRRAFTFLEVAIAVAILGILLAVAAPRWADAVGRHQARGAARRLAADLRLVAVRADAKSASIRVEFYPALHEYCVLGTADPDAPGADYRVNLKRLHGAALAAVDFGGQTSVTFNGFGVPDAPGSVTLQAGGQVAVVSVDAAGRVSGP
jgi:prepilin-type N-terminal cleavage/methylation domain-containing protein